MYPVKETHSVEIGWPLPEQHSHYLSKPASYLSHLFGHEGAGSILSLLKVRACGPTRLHPCYLWWTYLSTASIA